MAGNVSSGGSSEGVGTMTVLTKQTIRTLTLPQGKREIFHWDEVTSGFGLRMRLDSDDKPLDRFVLSSTEEAKQDTVLH